MHREFNFQSKVERFLRSFIPVFFWIPGLALAADNFQITAQPSASTYNVNQPVTFTIQARTGGSPDNGFTGTVTLGLYDNATIGNVTPTLTDGQALYLNTAGTVTFGTGTAVITFVSNGAVTVKVVPKTGHDSEAFLVQDPTITTGDNIGPFNVVGFSTTYFLEDADGNTILASYPPDADILTTDSNAATNTSDVSVDIPYSLDGSNAAALTIGSVNGSYAFGGADITTKLWARKRSGAANAQVLYQVILDYTGGVTDFNNIPPGDTIYGINPTDTGGAFAILPPASLQGGSAPLSTTTGFAGGQVILRIWSIAPPTSVISQLRIKTSGVVTNASNITIPYSNLNAVVRGSLTPKTVLLSSPVTMVYNIQNLASIQLGETKFKIPANPGGTGATHWTLASTPTTRGAGVNITYLNPTLSTNGYVDIQWNSSPVTVNEIAPVTMVFSTSSDISQSGWDFGFLIVKDTTTNNVNNDSVGAQDIQTVGIPSTTSSFTALPANFISPGTGNDIALAWASATNQGALGYVLSRGTGGGMFANSVTLPSGTIVANAVTLTPADTATQTDDSTAANLTGYSYTLRTYNAVAESPATTVGPVTAFVNPGPPTGLAAFTGGAAVSLNWATPTATPGAYPVTGYQVLRDTSPSMATAVTLTTLAAATTHYTDGSPAAGVTNYYELVSLDNQYPSGPAGAHFSLPSNQAQAFPPGYPPTGLAAQLTPGVAPVLKVSWTAPSAVSMVSGPATGYQVSLAPDGVFSSFVTAASATYTDASVAAGHYYVYAVKAFDNAGFLSNSAAVTGYTGPPILPTPTAIPAPAAVSLTFPPLSNTASETITGYLLYRNGSPLGTPLPTTTATVTVADGSAVLGVDYNYQVAAVDSNGITGVLSGGVSGARLPSVPTGLTTSLNTANNNVTVGWATPVIPEPNLQKYYLVQSKNGGAPTTLATPAPAATSFLDTTPLTAGDYVVYTLTAQNDLGGLSPAAGPITAFVGPGTPVSLVATGGTNNVSLSWPKVADSLGETIASYRVYQNGVSIGTVATGPATLAFVDPSPIQGTNYNYQVSAVDTNAIEGNKSSPAVTSALLPLVPQSFAVTVQQTGVSFNVQLTWNAPVSSANVTSYNIRNNPTDQTFGNSVFLAAVPFAFAQPYVNAQPLAAAGTTIAYFIRGVDPGGPGAIANTGLQIPPNPVTITSATPSSGSIAVSWTVSPPSEHASNYTLYRMDLASPGVTVVAGTTGSGAITTLTDSSGLSRGATYVYLVTATNPGGGAGFPGGEGLPSAPVTTGLAPLAPGGLAATVLNNLTDPVSFSWTNVQAADANAVSVIVTRNGSPVTTLASSAVSYIDNAAAPDTSYTYTLATTNPFGTGANATPVTVLTYPGAVSLMPVTLAPDNVSRLLEWTTPATPSAVVSYNVYRQQLPSGAVVNTHNYLASSLPFPGNPVTLTLPVQPGKSYVYWITALNATGEGPLSNPQTIGIAPSVPAGVTAISGLSTSSDGVSLSWNPNSPSENVTGYTVYRSTTPGNLASYALAGGVTATSTNFVDPGLADKTAYYYLIGADEISGNESILSTANAVTVTAFMAPNVPTGAAANPGTGQATVSWTVAPATSYPVTGYNVRQVSGGVTQAANPPSSITSPLTALGLTNGNAYSFLIQTVDSQGHVSAFSAPSGPVTPIQPPAVPNPVGGSPGNNANNITWASSVPGTLPVSFYNIQRTTLPPGPTVFFQAPASLTGYVDSTASNGISYAYSVQAVDNNSVTTAIDVSAFSPPVTLLTGQLVINPPSQIAALAGSGVVTLTWVDSVGSGSPVTGYQIFRSGAFLNSVGTGVQTFTDSTAANGTLYSYYLVSHSGGLASGASATVFAIPAAPPLAPTPIIPTAGIGQAALTWTASAGVGSVTISQYLVDRAVLPGGSAPLTALAGNVLNFTDSPLTAGTTVVYTIAAVNSNGTTGVASAPVSAYPYVDFTPNITGHSASSTAVTINFNQPGIPTWSVTQYTLIRTPLGGGTPVTVNSGSSPIIDSSGVPGQLYAYTLTATDNKGNTSTAAGPVTDGPANPPPAPTIFIVSPGSQEVLLDWAPSAPVTGESLPISYILTFSGAHSGSVTLPSTQTSYLDDNGGAGFTDPASINYSLQVVDASVIASSPAHASTVTGPIPATTGSGNLNPPSGLTAKAINSKSVSLTWTPPNDLGRVVVSYQLFRSENFTTSFASIATFANSALTPTTSYIDTTAQPGKTYYYVLQAGYLQVPATVYSSNSNHAFDTTPLPTTTPPPVGVSQMGFDANLLTPLSGQTLGIYYVVPTDGTVEIDIYNISGNIIRVLYPGQASANVTTQTTWDGTDRNGKVVASGLYFIEIKSPGFHQVKKVAVVK